jgi:bifunctional UDP-N-acetylglucosamine pyrophosphorylase/glucosamine-1-phosphate N-acetyltransferase
VLAAGEGTRMKSQIAKPLIPLCGKPMILHVLENLEDVGAERVIVVVGSRREQVIAALALRREEFAVQDPPLGTGHAVQCAEHLLDRFDGDVLVTCADIPLVRAETLRRLLDEHWARGAAATLLTALYENPTGYGRIVRDASGAVTSIVEEKEADDAIRAVREINTGVYVFRAPLLLEALRYIEPSNVKGELYLTDVIAVLRSHGQSIAAVAADNAAEVIGVNDRVQLADAERTCRDRIRERLMRDGVTMIDPPSTFIDGTVVIGPDTVLMAGVHLLGHCSVGARCTIGPNCFLENSSLGDGCTLSVGAVMRDSKAASACSLGPYCHVRDHSTLADRVRVGSYTEIVRTAIGAGSKALHFSYLGDATLGEDVNIGAGTVTCNYDGRRKSPTVIESHSFVGSDAILVAPVRVGEGAYVAAGSVITQDVPPGSLAIARERQTVIPDWARRRSGGSDLESEA